MSSKNSIIGKARYSRISGVNIMYIWVGVLTAIMSGPILRVLTEGIQVKLYNKSRYPDDLLESLLSAAGRAVGAWTGGVIVVATDARKGYAHCHGTAYECYAVAWWHLADRAHTKNGDWRKGYIDTDGGYFRITLPDLLTTYKPQTERQEQWFERARSNLDGLHLSELIYSVAAHEWQHIKQYQQHKFSFRDRKECRKRHDNRSWERDAIKAASLAQRRPRNSAQNSILNMALWIEGQVRP